MQLNQCKRCLQWEKESKNYMFGVGEFSYKFNELNEEGICPDCVTDLNKIAYDRKSRPFPSFEDLVSFPELRHGARDRFVEDVLEAFKKNII